jgi:perosamine synthetase
MNGLDNLLTYFRGRVACNAILRALDVGPGDKVAIQAFTCLAVPEAVIARGATPVFVDVAPGEINMSADDLKRKVDASTKAIIVQHTFGIPAELDAICAAAEHIPIIEDCCHAIDSMYQGRVLGGFGVGAFYSFEWGKPVVAGVGGAAKLNRQDLYDRMRREKGAYPACRSSRDTAINLQYLAYSLLYRPGTYWILRDLYKKLSGLRMFVGSYATPAESAAEFDVEILRRDFQGYAMAPSVERRLARRLKHTRAVTEHSRKISHMYDEAVAGSTFFETPAVPAPSDVVYSRYPLRARSKQEALSRAMRARIEVAGWYTTPVHPLSGKQLEAIGYQAGSCPHAEALCGNLISLPTNPKTGVGEAHRICDFLKSFN